MINIIKILIIILTLTIIHQEIHNKNKSPKRSTEKHTPPASNRTMQKSHEDIDILGIQIEASTSTPKSEN